MLLAISRKKKLTKQVTLAITNLQNKNWVLLATFARNTV